MIITGKAHAATVNVTKKMIPVITICRLCTHGCPNNS
jgi:hypothetical protein